MTRGAPPAATARSLEAGAGADTGRRDRGRPVTPAGDPIMGAKFRVPAIKPPVLLRRRLLARLTDGVQGSLSLLSAPAGCGKTVLASSWMSTGTAPGPLTWITLDDEDGRSGIFWCYVLEGLSRA